MVFASSMYCDVHVLVAARPPHPGVRLLASVRVITDSRFLPIVTTVRIMQFTLAFTYRIRMSGMTYLFIWHHVHGHLLVVTFGEILDHVLQLLFKLNLYFLPINGIGRLLLKMAHSRFC